MRPVSLSSDLGTIQMRSKVNLALSEKIVGSVHGLESVMVIASLAAAAGAMIASFPEQYRPDVLDEFVDLVGFFATVRTSP